MWLSTHWVLHLLRKRRDFTQVFGKLYLLQLPGSHWQQAMAFSGWDGALAADCLDVSQSLQQQELPPPQPPPPPQQKQEEQDDSSLARLGHTTMYRPQGTAQPQQLTDSLLQEAAAKQQGTTQQHQHQQQQVRQQCQQVPAECMAWAGRPQFRLQTASTCEVVLCLQQCDTRLLRPQVGFNHSSNSLPQACRGLSVWPLVFLSARPVYVHTYIQDGVVPYWFPGDIC
jgi:hypothetical protein